MPDSACTNPEGVASKSSRCHIPSLSAGIPTVRKSFERTAAALVVALEAKRIGYYGGESVCSRQARGIEPLP
ncbi:MAG: hypothetical protein HY692_06800 [Cyanobacteria bacterium NC_groundwater_1444_Ag_S-0.65um_54_12]|nr:hypothetical protein [Cyanobacteria bacterium NC_groundwater_1444_Ag_S-0.65um_54_12]